jgi:SAM-dependent methyltransferase
MRMTGEHIVEFARGGNGFQPMGVVAMHHDATLPRQDEFGGYSAFDAGGLGNESRIAIMPPVGIADGHMGADAVLHANGRQQIDHVFTGIAAMDEMARALLDQEVQRPPGLGQVVVGVGQQADFHAGSVVPPAPGRNPKALLACSAVSIPPYSPPDMNRHAFFEELAGEENPLAFKPEHESRIDRLQHRLGDLRGKRVFEPGCGAGPLTARLAEWVGETGRVLALDACGRMTSRCGQAMAGHGHVRVLHGKAEKADLDPGAWDLILCFRFYPHLEDAAEFLRRCKMWLAPGGELVIANLEGSRQLNALHERLVGVHEDVMPTGEELRLHLQASGWQVIDVLDQPEEFFLRARLA